MSSSSFQAPSWHFYVTQYFFTTVSTSVQRHSSFHVTDENLFRKCSNKRQRGNRAYRVFSLLQFCLDCFLSPFAAKVWDLLAWKLSRITQIGAVCTTVTTKIRIPFPFHVFFRSPNVEGLSRFVVINVLSLNRTSIGYLRQWEIFRKMPRSQRIDTDDESTLISYYANYFR